MIDTYIFLEQNPRGVNLHRKLLMRSLFFISVLSLTCAALAGCDNQTKANTAQEVRDYYDSPVPPGDSESSLASGAP